jgi:competence protein ComEC
MYIHFIDVGQADCILLMLNDSVMLIDAGNNSDDKMIVQYLKDLNISTIDYFILTHPHEDHIGGADTVINTFTVKNVFMSDKEATTKTYKDVMAAINNNGIAPHYVTPGEKFFFDEAEVLVIGPYDCESDEPNNSSVAVKITYGNDTMLFAGDTESQYEKLIVDSGKFDLRAELYKADHHGSGGANSYVWLREINPKYVVIQCETGNKYGHPHEEALSRFNDVGAIIYRNDTMGTIIATVTGSGIYFNKEGIEPTRPHVDTY